MPVFRITNSVGSNVSLRWGRKVQDAYCPRFQKEASAGVRQLYDDMERLDKREKISFKAYFDRKGQLWVKKSGLFNGKDEKIQTGVNNLSEKLFELWATIRRKNFSDSK